MYLEHFGLNEPPFKITPVTEFFFSGANRGEILDALVYAIINSEGIIKISGEVGSGKTMLCRMLLERLPPNIKAIYLANPSLTRDELLYAIADRLDLDLDGQRINVLMQNLQNHLVLKYSQGIRCVVLVDEAHAMPLDTLEELRLLYNLQVGKHKLIQIVLFGQPELDEKLAQTNMRQLKDRILHNFNILPLSPKVIDTYLMFRMRAAGYKGPDIFSPAATKLISNASQGLMRRVNILADKALLAAFVENTHNIEVRHVQAAIRDSELAPSRSWASRKHMLIAGAASLLAVLLVGVGTWIGNRTASPDHQAQLAEIKPITISPAPAPVAPIELPASAVAPASQAVAASAASASSDALQLKATATIQTASNPGVTTTKPLITLTAEDERKLPPLLLKRLQSTQDVLNNLSKGSVSIQLFYTDDVRPDRMERFLVRAKQLGKLQEIYILPININGSSGYRVLYGIYPDSEAANEGLEKLPQRYKEAFAPALYIIPSTNVP